MWNYSLKPPPQAAALRDGTVFLFGYANYANYYSFICLIVTITNAYLSAIGMSGPEVAYSGGHERCCATRTTGVPDFPLPWEVYASGGAYSWHPSTCRTCFSWYQARSQDLVSRGANICSGGALRSRPLPSLRSRSPTIPLGVGPLPLPFPLIPSLSLHFPPFPFSSLPSP